MHYPCTENKGADQMCSYAQLFCAFVFAYASSVGFSDAAALIVTDIVL